MKTPHLMLASLLSLNVVSQAPPAVGVGNLEVRAANQFEPIWWRFTLQAPRDRDIVVSQKPTLYVELRWEDAWRSFGSLSGDERSQSRVGSTEKRDQRITVPVGTTAGWLGTLQDWRILGWEGRYRCKVTWSELGGVRGNSVGQTQWTEFNVGPAGESGRALATSKAGQGDLWRAYKKCMEEASDFVSVGSAWQSESSPVGQALKGMMESSRERRPWEIVGEASSLPPRVREVVEMERARWQWQVARSVGRGAGRNEALGRALSTLEGLLTSGIPTRERAFLLKMDVLQGLERAQELAQCRQIAAGSNEIKDAARLEIRNWEEFLAPR
jgi:hypothetical protein